MDSEGERRRNGGGTVGKGIELGKVKEGVEYGGANTVVRVGIDWCNIIQVQRMIANLTSLSVL